jgi:hypothetical protein
LGVVVAALGGAYGTWALLRPAPQLNTQKHVTAPNGTAAAPTPIPVIDSAPAAAAPTEAPRPAPATSNAAAVTPREGKSESAVSERGDLREEIRAIDAVRSALAAREPARALSLLRRYASHFPGGTFAQEATVLRIEALEQSGQHQRAQALSRDFQSKHPNSPLSERLQRLAR